MPKLSIIIVNYKTPELLRLCLKAIDEHLIDLNYEIAVVDNAATSSSPLSVPPLIHKRGLGGVVEKITYLPFKNNIGFSRGVNAGLRATTGEYRLILNPDAVITAGSVQRMLAYMDQHADIGVLGPQLRYFNDEHQRSYFRFYRPSTILARRTPLGRLGHFKAIEREFMMLDTDPALIQTPDWILGAAMMVRGSAMEKVGLMDERFFLYFEDVDWCRRFWHNGYKVVYYPHAIFYHYYPRSSAQQWNKTTWWHIRSAAKFFFKYSYRS